MRTTARTVSAAPARPGRRGGVRVLVAAVAVASAAVAGLGIAGPAQAAGSKHPRVIAVAASSDYLVYRQKTATAYGLSLTEGSTLHWIGKQGGRHRLAGFDPQAFPTLQSSTVTQAAGPNSRYDDGYDPARPEHVLWRDLRTGASGIGTIPAGDDYVAAAPGGWIATRTVAGAAKRVVRWSTAGRAVDLGTPMIGSSLFRVVPGPDGVLAYSTNEIDLDGTGLIRYMPYRTPGRWRTVHSAGAGVSTFCGRVSVSHVVCEVGASAGKRSGQVLLPLTAGRKVWLSDHRKVCQVVGLSAIGSAAVGKATSDQGPCVAQRLVRLSSSGTATTSTRSWGAHASGITEGFGRILLDSTDQRRIVSLTGLRGAPRTVVTAR